MKMNVGRFFYKTYFQDVNFNDILKAGEVKATLIKERNRKLLEASLEQIPSESFMNHNFELQVAYPGLITGVGIIHEAKLEGEFKLGMHFDYTSGMPVVYGSSVKGVLRSAFGLDGYVRDLLVEIDQQKRGNLAKIDLKLLEMNIFEGKTGLGENLSVYQRDIFFDAVITGANPQGNILASDSITPHLKGPLKDPKPITFLKIASGVKMEFRFKLEDALIGGLLFPAEAKRFLFEKIIRDLGIGAKTNVGYGRFR